MLQPSAYFQQTTAEIFIQACAHQLWLICATYDVRLVAGHIVGDQFPPWQMHYMGQHYKDHVNQLVLDRGGKKSSQFLLAHFIYPHHSFIPGFIMDLDQQHHWQLMRSGLEPRQITCVRHNHSSLSVTTTTSASSPQPPLPSSTTSHICHQNSPHQNVSGTMSLGSG